MVAPQHIPGEDKIILLDNSESDGEDSGQTL